MMLADTMCKMGQVCGNIQGLFACPKTRCAAICVAVAAFVLGALVACLICRLRRRCSCSGKTSPQSTYQKRPMKGGFEKRRPAPADGSIEIYVGNLSYDLTEDILRKEFEAFGKVNSARIIINHYNGKSKGFGFIHMANGDEADAAVAALNDKDLLGRRLKCNKARNA